MLFCKISLENNSLACLRCIFFCNFSSRSLKRQKIAQFKGLYSKKSRPVNFFLNPRNSTACVMKIPVNLRLILINFLKIREILRLIIFGTRENAWLVEIFEKSEACVKSFWKTEPCKILNQQTPNFRGYPPLPLTFSGSIRRAWSANRRVGSPAAPTCGRSPTAASPLWPWSAAARTRAVCSWYFCRRWTRCGKWTEQMGVFDLNFENGAKILI